MLLKTQFNQKATESNFFSCSQIQSDVLSFARAESHNGLKSRSPLDEASIEEDGVSRSGPAVIRIGVPRVIAVSYQIHFPGQGCCPNSAGIWSW